MTYDEKVKALDDLRLEDHTHVAEKKRRRILDLDQLDQTRALEIIADQMFNLVNMYHNRG